MQRAALLPAQVQAPCTLVQTSVNPAGPVGFQLSKLYGIH